MRRVLLAWSALLLLLLAGCQAGEAPPPDDAVLAPRYGFMPAFVELVDPQVGWGIAAGEFGLYRTTDGGQRWTDVTPPEADGAFDVDLAALTADRAWLVLTHREPDSTESFAVVEVFRTTDGGAHWERSAFTTPFQTLYGASVSFLNERQGFILVEPEHGMSSRPGVLYRTDDGGKRWTLIAGADVMPFAGTLRFTDPFTLWVAGHQVSTTPDELAVSRDGGRTWEAVPMPLPPDEFPPGQVSILAPPHLVGDRLIIPAVFWPESARADQWRTLVYASGAPGAGWQLLASAVPPGGVLAWGSDRHGWLWAGEPASSGTKAPVSGAFRLTEDGGATWREVAPDATLQSWLDQGYNIVHLDFAGPRAGWAVLRALGERPPLLLSTQDGGRTWTTLGVEG